MRFISKSIASLFLFASGVCFSNSYYIDQDSVKTFGPGCPSNDDVFVAIDEDSVNVIYANLNATAIDGYNFSNCSVFFDVYADEHTKIAAPQVIMSVNYAIDDGGKGIASAKLTTLGESRTAKVENLYGVGSRQIQSPLAPFPRYSKCGGKLTFRVTGRVTSIAPSHGGSSTVTMDDSLSESPYSIKCPIVAHPCP